MDAGIDMDYDVDDLVEVNHYIQSGLTGTGSLVKTFIFKDGGEYDGFAIGYPDDYTPAEKWFNYCMAQMTPSIHTYWSGTVETIPNGFSVCTDGTVIGPIIGRVGVAYPPEDIESSSIGSPWFGGGKNLQINYSSWSFPVVMHFESESELNRIREMLLKRE
jgi:hypothetical protein